MTQDLRRRGGLFTATSFLNRVLLEQSDYDVEIVSLAMSAVDESSVRLRAPGTWHRQPSMARVEYGGLLMTHVGASVAE